MKQEKIDRINTLYHKSQAVGLTEEEKKEQTFSLYVDELLCDKTDVIKSVKISLTQLFS